METQRMMRYEANKKSIGVAYLLWFFLGSVGAHRFYLGKTGSAVAILLLTLLSIPLMAIGLGFFTIFISAIWVLVDLFLIPGMTREYNNNLVDLLSQ